MPDKLLIDTLYKEMLLSTICMSSFELLWTQFEGNRDMYVLTVKK